MDALPNEIISMILDDVIAPNIRHQRHAWDMILVCKCVCKLWYAVTWRATGYPSTLYESSEYSRAMFCAALRGRVELVEWLHTTGCVRLHVYQGAVISGASEIIAWCREWYQSGIEFNESVIYMALRYCNHDDIDKVMRRFDNTTVEFVCYDNWKIIDPRVILYIHTRHAIHFGEYIYKLLHEHRFDVLEWLLANGIGDCTICEHRTRQKIYEMASGSPFRRVRPSALEQYFAMVRKYKTSHGRSDQPQIVTQ